MRLRLRHPSGLRLQMRVVWVELADGSHVEDAGMKTAMRVKP